MAESKTNLTDFMDIDLEGASDTGYERDFDVEIIDRFYHQNIAFMNEKVRLFADYWMKLYSNCCLQRDYAVELLNEKKPDEARAALQDWPAILASPNVPQLLFEESQESKRKKRSAALIECDAVSLIKEMEDNYTRGEKVVFDVPNVLEDDISLADYETRIQECENCFKSVENYFIQNAFMYGAWLCKAFVKFQEEKNMKRVYGNFDDWVDLRCKVKKTRARQLRLFYKLFHPYKKVLGCKLPFIWFVKNGKTIVDYFKSHHEAGQPWTHEVDCACGISDFTTAMQ